MPFLLTCIIASIAHAERQKIFVSDIKLPRYSMDSVLDNGKMIKASMGGGFESCFAIKISAQNQDVCTFNHSIKFL